MDSKIDNRKENQFKNSEESSLHRLFLKRHTESMLGGVCIGVSKFIKIEVIYIRIMFVIASMISGWGLLIYLLLLLTMDDDASLVEESIDKKTRRKFHMQNVFAITLSFIGLYYLMKNLGFFSFFWFFDPTSNIMLPAIFLFLGVYYLRKKSNNVESEINSTLNFCRSRSDKRIAGVTKAFSEYLNIDITIVRMFWLFSIFATLGITLLIYFYLAYSLSVCQEGPDA